MIHITARESSSVSVMVMQLGLHAQDLCSNPGEETKKKIEMLVIMVDRPSSLIFNIISNHC